MVGDYGYPEAYDVVAIGGQSTRRDAIISGQIDLVLLGAANAIQAEGTGEVTVLREYLEYNSPAPNDLFCANREWYESTPGAEQAVLDFTKAVLEAARWFHSDPDGWEARFREEVPDFPADQIDDMRESFIEVGQYPPNGTLSQEGVDAAVQLGLDDGSFTQAPATEDWVDFSFEQRALQELGTFPE